MKFNELNIKPEILKSVEAKGFEGMTDIQAESIPPALEGKDVLGQAQTGTGKTAAFLIPILENLDMEAQDLQTLILVPTRELALQVNKEAQELGKDLGVKSVAVFGGDPIDKQIQLLKGKPQIVVGTPGRCIDLINRKKIKLHNIKFFALDEVDEMLNMGFIEDIEFISEKMPKEKQTLLFSATMPDRIKKITNKYLIDPVHVKVKSKSITADRVEQSYIIVKQKQKPIVLKNIIDLNQNDKIIIFTQTKRSADEVYEFLQKQGLSIGKIHGDLPQASRTRTIQAFRDNKLNYLVATDVVARGIDIDNINLVINYELPQDIEYYIHRIGRTARGIDTNGRSITLVTPSAFNKEFRHYEKQLGIKIKEEQQPKLGDVINLLKEKYYNEIINEQTDVEKVYKDLADQLIENRDGMELLELLLVKAYPQLSKKETMKLLPEDNNDRGNRGGRGGGKGKSNSSRNGRGNGKGRGGRGNGGRDNRKQGRGNGGNKNKGNKKR